MTRPSVLRLEVVDGLCPHRTEAVTAASNIDATIPLLRPASHFQSPGNALTCLSTPTNGPHVPTACGTPARSGTLTLRAEACGGIGLTS